MTKMKPKNIKTDKRDIAILCYMLTAIILIVNINFVPASKEYSIISVGTPVSYDLFGGQVEKGQTFVLDEPSILKETCIYLGYKELKKGPVYIELYKGYIPEGKLLVKKKINKGSITNEQEEYCIKLNKKLEAGTYSLVINSPKSSTTTYKLWTAYGDYYEGSSLTNLGQGWMQNNFDIVFKIITKIKKV